MISNCIISRNSVVESNGGTNEGGDTAIAVETYGYKEVFKSNVTEIISMPSK